MQPIDTIAVRAGSAAVTLYSRHSQTKRRVGSFLLSTAARDLCLIARSRSLRIAPSCRLLRRHSPTKRRVGSFLLSTAARDPLFGALVTLRTFRPSLSSATPPQYCPLASANAANAGVLPC
jgi:hypothetical protein